MGYIWWGIGRVDNPKNPVAAGNHSSGSIMLRGCLAASGTSAQSGWNIEEEFFSRTSEIADL